MTMPKRSQKIIILFFCVCGLLKNVNRKNKQAAKGAKEFKVKTNCWSRKDAMSKQMEHSRLTQNFVPFVSSLNYFFLF